MYTSPIDLSNYEFDSFEETLPDTVPSENQTVTAVYTKKKINVYVQKKDNYGHSEIVQTFQKKLGSQITASDFTPVISSSTGVDWIPQFTLPINVPETQ